MDYLLGFAIGVAITWVMLMIVIPIARLIADFSLPPWPETMVRLLVIAAAVNFIQIFLGEVNGLLAIIASAIVFFTLLHKWFDVDVWAAIMIVIISWAVRMALFWALVRLLLSLRT
jgi:hypothetical protein